MKPSNFINLALLTFVLITTAFSAGCSNKFSDKFEGVWISDTVLYYDYSKFRFDTFPTNKLPNDLFTDRYISIVKITKIQDDYDVTVTNYSLLAINKSEGNYIGQLDGLKRYDDRSLRKGHHDPNAVSKDNMLFVNVPDYSTVKVNVKNGNRTKQESVEAHAHYVFVCNERENTLQLKQYYFETDDGQRIEVPLNDTISIHGTLKKHDENYFQKLCDDIWKKSFDIAGKIS